MNRIEQEIPLCGAVRRIENGDSWTPCRFSEKQMAFYAADKGYHIRATASAGVCAECVTDAEAFFIQAEAFPGSSQDLWAFDVLVDGRLYAHREGSISQESQIVWEVALPKGVKRVKVCFPHLAGVNVKRLQWKNAATVRPALHRERLLCLGDSITQGYVTHFASHAYPHLLAEKLDAVMVNQAIGGETFDPPMLDANLGFEPTIVTIAYGTNDWRCKRRDAFLRDAEEFLARARRNWPDAYIAAVSPIWRPDGAQVSADFPFEDMRVMLGQLAKAQHIALIDGGDLLPRIPALFHDNVHPNDLGMQLYGKYLAEEIQKAIQQGNN